MSTDAHQGQSRLRPSGRGLISDCRTLVTWPSLCTLFDIYQEQQRVVDDELSGEPEQILIHSLKQSRDQNHGQIMSRHLVHLREHLDPEEDTDLESELILTLFSAVFSNPFSSHTSANSYHLHSDLCLSRLCGASKNMF